MLLKDFKTIFSLTILVLLGFWIICSFLAIGYEAGTDDSLLGRVCYKIASSILFALDFWARSLPTWIALTFSFITSSILISLFILFIKKIIHLLFKI